MTIGLILPPHRNDAVDCARHTVRILKDLGVTAAVEPACLSLVAEAASLTDFPAPDCIISIGGDGTLLRAAGLASVLDIPLLGINTGHLGFLTEIAPSDISTAINRLLHGDYTIDTRSMLEAEVPGWGTFTVLNDAIITRAGTPRLIRMRLLIDGEYAAGYMSDGLIVSTPTGSTGYSLSAGGPIVSPQVDCMLVTPVCDHSLVHRPLVVHSSAQLTVQLEQDEEMRARLQADGQTFAQLQGGSTVTIRRSARQVRLVRMEELHFYTRVYSKLYTAPDHP